ncbi:hypothetical protein [Rubripirellula lacrimiformis]|uniref:hypothetical protein n=1 Tax=Rubripirellula lacrimiformis TaxID=1930273 RepID=UPI001C54C18E|nr:hypothetical protein [Rubripirellula lacrimiformis]
MSEKSPKAKWADHESEERTGAAVFQQERDEILAFSPTRIAQDHWRTAKTQLARENSVFVGTTTNRRPPNQLPIESQRTPPPSTEVTCKPPIHGACVQQIDMTASKPARIIHASDCEKMPAALLAIAPTGIN